MYLISAYFDNHTSKIVNRYIRQIAGKTGNLFMIENHVPPHLTISSVEARNGELLIPHVRQLEKVLVQGSVNFVSVGMFLPYVLYLTPVLNEYLMGLSGQIYDAVKDIPEVTVSRFYQPMQWLPHITLGKKLTKEQMRVAFEIMQDGFVPFEGKITAIGLAKTNPHEDILMMELAANGIVEGSK